MDSHGNLNYANTRKISRMSVLDREFFYSKGCTSDIEGLHKNCAGCEHIVDKKCKYVRFPKRRKWPCYFR